MSSLSRLKREIKTKRAQNTSFNAYRDMHAPDEKHQIILPKKPRNSEKLLGVEEEAKRSAHRNSSKRKGREGEGILNPITQIDKEEEEDSDDDEKNKKKKKKKGIQKVAWGPKEILEHLEDENVVLDLQQTVLPSLTTPSSSSQQKGGEEADNDKEKIVWDHGDTKEGEKSDNNFFLWLEAYSSFICKQKKRP